MDLANPSKENGAVTWFLSRSDAILLTQPSSKSNGDEVKPLSRNWQQIWLSRWKVPPRPCAIVSSMRGGWMVYYNARISPTSSDSILSEHAATNCSKPTPKEPLWSNLLVLKKLASSFAPVMKASS